MGRGVFVVGMHRSGTSAAARLVNLLGVPTCVDEDLLDPTDDNPRGFWESASLAELNDRLLAALDSDWACPPILEPGWETQPGLDRVRVDALSQFPRVFPTAPWVWKDPRNCVTFAFWADALEVDPVVVLVERNPLAIATSLNGRDGFGTLYTLALWERYLRACLTSIAGLPVLVTDYDDLVSSPLEWCGEVRKFLLGAGIETDGIGEADALDFVDGDLRHATFAATELRSDAAVSDAQRRLFDLVEELRGAHESFPAVDLPDETPTTEALLAERRRVLEAVRGHIARFDELTVYSEGLGERYVELEEYTRQLQKSHAELEEYTRELQKSHADLEEFTRELQQRHAALEEFTRGLQERFAALEDYARGLQQRFCT